MIIYNRLVFIKKAQHSLITFTQIITVFFLLFFYSCKKSEKDFIGKYQTLYPAEVKLSSSFNYSMLYNSNQKHTAHRYYELLPVKLNIFEDESDKKLKGEVEIIFLNEHNFSLNPTASKDKMDFDIVNFRMEKDTLHFQIENQMLKLSGKKIKGLLVNDGKKSVIGLETDSFGFNDYSIKNPFFIKRSDDMIYYKVVTSDSVNILKKNFYDNQIKDYEIKRTESKNYHDSIYFENSIEKVKTLYN